MPPEYAQKVRECGGFRTFGEVPPEENRFMVMLAPPEYAGIQRIVEGARKFVFRRSGPLLGARPDMHGGRRVAPKTADPTYH